MPAPETKKARQLLESARMLFNKHGVRKVTIDEICRRAGASKMTFYKFFKNKQDISIKVLDQIVQEAWDQYQEIMARPIAFGEKIEAILQMKITASQNLGREFLQDLVEGDERLQTHMREIRQASVRQSLDLLEQGKQAGVIRSDLQADFFLYMIEHIQSMLEDTRLRQMFPDVRQRTVELVKFWFYGMFNAIG